MKKFCIVLILTFFSSIGFAQQAINGLVLDEAGAEPIIGASILVKGTSVGTSSDVDGKFTLRANPGQILVVSFMGMASQNVTVTKGNTNLIIKLTKNAVNLDEVVVVGYGVTRKRDIAGAITSLKRDEIKAGVVTNTAQLLKGRAAGVQVRLNSNEPGGEISIRIRGASSLSSGNDPLYVIDGFQTDIGNQINPEDIQSLEILKDAAATAIYGAKGANGVVLITTKKGTAGHFNVNYSYNISAKKLNNPWDLMDAQKTINYAMDTWKAAGSAGNAPYTAAQLAYKGTGTDWIKEATRTALTQNHQFSIDGGSDKLRMAISGNYMDDMGVMKNTDFNRFSGRMNMDYKLNDRVRFGSNLYMARTNKNYLSMGTNSTTDNMIYSLFMASPLSTDTDKNVFGETAKRTTILDQINDVDFEYLVNNMYASIYGEADILKNLTAKVQYTYGDDNTRSHKYYPVSTNIGKANNGESTLANYVNEKHQLDALLTFHQNFNKKHDVKVMLGSTYISLCSESNGMQAIGFSTDEFSFNNIGAGSTINYVRSAKEQNKTLSFFTRAEYVLNDKYILNASCRADGASNFGSNNKWGYFPSGSFAWQFGDEPFMAFAKPLFSRLKLRTSYGLTGNDGIGNYLSQVKFAMCNVYLGGDGAVKGMYPSNPGNKNLKWETTSQFDLGLDFTMLNNRLECNFDYYIKTTKDLLNNISISASTGGFTNMTGNNGKIQNKGFEFFLKSNNYTNKDFSWTSVLNLSRNKNKVVSLNKGEARYETISPQGWYNNEEYTILKEGYPLSSIYGYEFAGVIQTGETYAPQPTSVAGDPKFVDLDGDGKITEKDRKVIGDGNPDIIIGLGNNFRFHDFDFSFFFDASIGNELLNLSRIVLEDNGRLNDSMDRWTQYHASNSVPRNGWNKNAGVKYGSYISSRFVEDASYLRLQNVEIGYNLPLKQNAKIYKSIKGMRIFAGAQNLFTITKYSGFDPEVSTNGGSAVSQGLDFSSYPSYRMFNFGAKIIF